MDGAAAAYTVGAKFPERLASVVAILWPRFLCQARTGAAVVSRTERVFSACSRIVFFRGNLYFRAHFSGFIYCLLTRGSWVQGTRVFALVFFHLEFRFSHFENCQSLRSFGNGSRFSVLLKDNKQVLNEKKMLAVL